MNRSPFAGRTGDPPEREIESRIPGAYRIFMVFLVIIPKMVISVALLFFGGKLVLRSDDSAEVIMNSLAAYFVAGTLFRSLRRMIHIFCYHKLSIATQASYA